MNSLALDIRSKLITLGMGVADVAADWSVHANAYPSSPARVIAVYSTSTQYQYLAGVKDTYDTDMFQIRVRGLTAVESEAKITAVRKALQRIGRFQMAPIAPATYVVQYQDILTTSGPTPMGFDGKNWYSHVISMKALREDIVPASP